MNYGLRCLYLLKCKFNNKDNYTIQDIKDAVTITNPALKNAYDIKITVDYFLMSIKELSIELELKYKI